MKRRINDSGSSCETIVNTYRSPSSSPPRSRAIISVVNVPYSPQVTNNVNHYSLGRTSPHNYGSSMPSLAVHDKGGSAVALSLSSHHVSAPQKCKPHSVSCNNMGQNPQQFQRLKVEDALSYLDQVKYKFSNQPNIYNDFLDIMKEFKAQSIDTPGVITRVSNLFKGYPELISGFNTFLPPGYKIEVQSNDSGYSFQVSVSVPSPSSSGTTTNLIPTQTVHYTSSIVTAPTTVLTGTGIISGHQVNQPLMTKSYTLPNAVNSCCVACNVNTVANNVITTQISNNIHKSPVRVNATFNQAQAHQAVSQALINVESGITSQPTQQNQPVEFNHAINYVNKIKNRFQGQPDKYKKFLEILHTYQKEQRIMKENQQSCNNSERTLTEAQVYCQVAKLFENQEDLLAEFGQFLPDATSHQANFNLKNNDFVPAPRKQSVSSFYICPTVNNNVITEANTCSVSVSSNTHNTTDTIANNNSVTVSKCIVSTITSSTTAVNSNQIKRSASFSGSHSDSSIQPPIKKHKPPCLRDVTWTEANRHCSLKELAFFDRIRKNIHNYDIYKNFLRCLYIYNYEIINRSELLMLASPFLAFYPDLFHWFKEFLGQSDTASLGSVSNSTSNDEHRSANLPSYPSTTNSRQEKNIMDIDYSTCKRIGASYCAVPDDFTPPKCSGRTQLCKEVLNDTWVSFPTWSEDSTFVSSRKTQYEEYIYRCEDERFELDVVIESNSATIRVLEAVQKKLSGLSSEEASRFTLDDCLGASSPTIHQKAIKRVYGERGVDVIEGLKANPISAVPVVLRRLKDKDDEWRLAQKGFNKVWREQNEKFYLKSLDHQGMNFKQNDVKYIRSKSLLNEIETLFDERHEHADENSVVSHGPHLILPYKDKNVIDDAANLLIHHVKRQTGINKEDKYKLKCLLRRFIPDLFHHPRQELSDDEKDDYDNTLDGIKKKSQLLDYEKNNNSTDINMKSSVLKQEENFLVKEELEKVNFDMQANANSEDIKVPLHAMSVHPDEEYSLIFGDNYWYLFFRLHQILCDRLGKMSERARILAHQELSSKENSKESASIALRLKPKLEIYIEDYYPALLDMVKNLLDGNLDCTTYEDTLREMFGIYAYTAFTLDKVVSHAVRQLQHLVTDDSCQQCYNLYMKECAKNATGGLCLTAYQRASLEANYQKKVEGLNLDSCYKIFIYKKNCKITIECIDSDGENADTQDNNDTYMDSEIGSDKYSHFTSNEVKPEPVK